MPSRFKSIITVLDEDQYRHYIWIENIIIGDKRNIVFVPSHTYLKMGPSNQIVAHFCVIRFFILCVFLVEQNIYISKGTCPVHTDTFLVYSLVVPELIQQKFHIIIM